MKQLITQIKKARSRTVSKLFASYRPYDGMEGTRHRILVTDVAADGKK